MIKYKSSVSKGIISYKSGSKYSCFETRGKAMSISLFLTAADKSGDVFSTRCIVMLGYSLEKCGINSQTKAVDLFGGNPMTILHTKSSGIVVN